jgi:hypothetical protein
MRRTTLLLAAIGLASMASAASADASGGEFRATQHAPIKEFPSKGVSGTAGHQELQLGSLTIACEAARSRNNVFHESETLPVEVSLKRCTVPIQAGEKTLSVVAKVEGPLELAYNATSGGAQLLNEVTVEIRALGCQGFLQPSQMTYGLEDEPPFEEELVATGRLKQFPSGVQRKLWIRGDEVGLRYLFLGKCAPLIGEDGVYRGTLSDEVPGGNLWWVPPPSPPPGWEIVENKEP